MTPALVKMCRFVFLGFGVIFIALGVAQVHKSNTLPAFTNEQAMEELRNEEPPQQRDERRIFWKNWFERARALEGGKFDTFDNGLIRISIGAVCLAFAILFNFILFTRPSVMFARGCGFLISILAGFSIFQYDNITYGRGQFNNSFDYGPTAFAGGVSAFITIMFSTLILSALIAASSRNKQLFWPVVPTNDHKRVAFVSLIFVPILILVGYQILSTTRGPAGWLDVFWMGYILVLFWWLYRALMTRPISKSAEL